MMKGICRVSANESGEVVYGGSVDRTGTLRPKNGEEYIVVIVNDNPDIASLREEKRLAEQSIKEYEKQMGYGIKFYHMLEYHGEANAIDIWIEFKNSDEFFLENTLAYAGFPIGSFRGKMVFNNKFPLLDGYNRTGAQLRELGIILPNMVDSRSYGTFSIRQIMKHEFGHLLGLEHEEDENSVMYAIYGMDRTMLSVLSKGILNDKYGIASFIKRALPDSWIRAVMKRRIKN